MMRSNTNRASEARHNIEIKKTLKIFCDSHALYSYKSDKMTVCKRKLKRHTEAAIYKSQIEYAADAVSETITAIKATPSVQVITSITKSGEWALCRYKSITHNINLHCLQSGYWRMYKSEKLPMYSQER